MSLKSYLADNKLLAYSDFCGYLFKIKDGYVKYSKFSKEKITHIPLGVIIDLPNFVSVFSYGYTEQDKEQFFEDSTRNYNTDKHCFVIANSTCNLSCPICIHRDLSGSKFPSVETILGLSKEYPEIKTLEITGGEPTLDRKELLDILVATKNIFKYIFIYTNGINLDQEFIDELNNLDPLSINLIVGLDSTDIGGHITLDAALDITNNLKLNSNVKIHYNILCTDTNGASLEDAYTLFRSINKVVDKIRFTPPLGISDENYYVDYLKTVLNFTDYTQFSGRSITAFNAKLNPSVRGLGSCNQKKLCIYNDAYTNCVYLANETSTYSSPFEMEIATLKKNKCLSCKAYPINCSSIIGTKGCLAYSSDCVLCPAQKTCRKRCELRSDLNSNDCLFLTTLHGYEHWLAIKDFTFEEVMARFLCKDSLQL